MNVCDIIIIKTSNNMTNRINSDECFAEGAAYYRMRKIPRKRKNDIAVNPENIARIKKLEDELNEIANNTTNLSQAKNEIQSFYFRLRKLLTHPGFKDKYGEDKSKQLTSLYTKIGFIAEDVNEIHDVAEANQTLQKWEDEFFEITGESKIVMPKK